MAKKMVRNEKGFTLIELVVVIVVLGILAAFAVSRYTRMATDARIAAVNGLAGGLRGAVAIVQGQYIAAGNTAAITVTMLDTTVVDVSSGAAGGIPTGAATGIAAAMRDYSGFTFTASGAGTPAYFTPTNGGGLTCRVEYYPVTIAPNLAGSVVALTGGC